MSLPMLQVALDNQTLSDAYETTRLIAEEVDIIEVGTILCVGEGVRAVRDLKAIASGAIKIDGVAPLAPSAASTAIKVSAPAPMFGRDTLGGY